jgi:hypothetical protein
MGVLPLMAVPLIEVPIVYPFGPVPWTPFLQTSRTRPLPNIKSQAGHLPLAKILPSHAGLGKRGSIVTDLHVAFQEKQNEAVPHPVAQILQQPDLAAALKGLNLVQAQDLLAASQTGILGNQKQEVGPNRVPEDWQQTLQDMLKNDRTPHPLTNHRCGGFQMESEEP